MQKKNVHTVDLNLFKTLSAMIQNRNGTLAAEQLGVSPSAVSHGLNKLRSLFDDELFIRTPSGMQPTERCMAISETVTLSVTGLVSLLEKDQMFDPSNANAVVNIAMSDLLSGMLPGALVRNVNRAAPKVSLRIKPAPGLAKQTVEAALIPALDAGELDFAFFWNYDIPARFSWRKIDEVYGVVVGSKTNVAFVNSFGADFYRTAPHVSTTTTGLDKAYFDLELAEVGGSRNVELRVPHFTSALNVVATTDMITTIPHILAPVARERFGLVVRDLPFDLRPRHLNLVWHKTRDADPLHSWMRQMVVESYWEVVEAA